MNELDYNQACQELWEEAAPIHEEICFDDLKKAFKETGYNHLNPIATELLTTKIRVKGRRVAHLCCNNGRELLSVKNLGAGRCVGFDFSDGFIEQARKLALSSGIECEFECENVLALPGIFESTFDIVIITAGTLNWFPSLTKLFCTISQLLTSSGVCLIYESHPVVNMFPLHTYSDTPDRSYFESSPRISNTGLDYWTGDKYDSKTKYWFTHSLSEIITAGTNNYLYVKEFKEYSNDILNGFRLYENRAAQFPVSMHFIFCKKSAL